MNESIFSVLSMAAIVGWACLGVGTLATARKLRAGALVLGGRWIPLGLCLAYAGLLVTHWGTARGGGFSSLAAVQALFSVPGKVLGGWVHFLAFDLLVGRWMVDDVATHGRSRWLLLPALPLTFLYGPLGVLVYGIVRWATRPRTSAAAGGT